MSDKKKRKNSPRATAPPHLWPVKVWQEFRRRLTANVNSSGRSYYHHVVPEGECPPELAASPCFYPTGSARITYVYRALVLHALTPFVTGSQLTSSSTSVRFTAP